MTFGHYGGIDEFGIFVIPALLAILALRWADRRARRALDEEEEKPMGRGDDFNDPE
jgi:hypothetical protein